MSELSRLDALRAACSLPLPHLDPAELEGSLRDCLDWILHDHWTLLERDVGRTATRSEMEALLLEPFPEEGQPWPEVMAAFRDKVAPYGLRVAHPRFFAFIPSAPVWPSVLGDVLSAGLNFFAGVWKEGAAAAQVELLVLDWFRQLLGLPPSTAGLLVSGGSEATLTALTVARDRLPFDQRPRAVLYVSDQRHWSVDRAALILGLAPERIRRLPTDASLRLHPEALRAAVNRDRTDGVLPWAVVATAGTTNTGTIDPLGAVADVCLAESLWLHVDAAYGWPAVLTEAGRTALAGIDRADSLTLDPHKWFAQTYEAGCVLVRRGELLEATFGMRPDYLQDVAPAADEVNFADRGLALTRRFRALKIWLSLRCLGIAWFRGLVEHGCRLAELAELLLQASGRFEMLHPRSLGIVCFRCRPPGRSAADLDELNLALAERSLRCGRFFLSTTRLAGKVALRLCFVNWRTTTADVEETIALLERWGGEGNDPA